METEPGTSGTAGAQVEATAASASVTELSDSQLLCQYVNARGSEAPAEAAFRELVQRHGPMVLGVCRQILRHPHDAEDAFQATFLVLVRKAPSIRVDHSLAPWLCSVAFRIAHRARDIASRFHSIDPLQIEEPAALEPDRAYYLDVRPLLHEELDRLPGKFRDAIVLCHLEGKSHEEAARLLRWPIGTVNSRLSRGRRLLRLRLERRGVEVSSAVFCSTWLAGTSTALASHLLERAVGVGISSAAAKTVPALVLSLTQGVLKTMWLRKLSTNVLAVLAIGTASGSLAVWAHWPSRQESSRGHASGAQTAKPGVHARDTEFSSQLSTQSQPAVQATGDGASRADRAAGPVDGLPADCPLSIAAGTLARMVEHLSPSSEPAR